MKLSKNFTLEELQKSQTAARRRIDNTAPDEVVANLKTLVENILQPVRDHFKKPVVISSGYRSPRLNRAIGGARTSQHVYGQAADFEIPGLSNYKVAKWIEENLPFDQLILEFYTPGQPNSGWVHVSYGPRNRKQVLTATRRGRKVVYLDGLIE